MSVPFPLRKKSEELAGRIPDLKSAALRTAFQVLHGTHPLRKAGDGETFWQFREYRPGDAPLSIDWRQSAKTGRVHVRERELQKAQAFLFHLKSGPDMGFSAEAHLPTKRRYAALLALTLALLHSREGGTVALAGRQKPGHSEKTIETFERLLLGESGGGEGTFGPGVTLPAIPAHAGLYVLSDFLEPPDDIRHTLAPAMARTKNGCALQILDPAEIEFPWRGRVQFENMSGGERHLADNAADIAAAYRARILGHIESVRDICARAGWRHILCRTDEDPAKPLLALRAHAYTPPPGSGAV